MGIDKIISQIDIRVEIQHHSLPLSLPRLAGSEFVGETRGTGRKQAVKPYHALQQTASQCRLIIHFAIETGMHSTNHPVMNTYNEGS
jgi:hypothetical protein